MNHLRDLLEQRAAVGVKCHKDTSDDIHHEALRFLAEHAPHAMCFYMGEGGTLAGVQWEAALCAHLPYRVCWFEFQHEYGFWGLLAVQLTDSVRLAHFDRQRGGWALEWLAESAAIGESLHCVPATPRTMADASNVVAGVAAFLTAMSCTNVGRLLNTPSAALQRARAKRGKAPLISYWTLHLTSGKGAGQPLGGTHAGPRVHLRRGHRRQHAPGKWTWVQEHVVGNREAGMVHKDYSATPKLFAAAKVAQEAKK